jgi:hypothetical protein
MRTLPDWMLDEKVVLCGMTIFCSAMVILLVSWHAEKEYVAIFGSGVTGLIGALLRGITHSPQVTDSTQTVSSVTQTTIEPKK